MRKKSEFFRSCIKLFLSKTQSDLKMHYLYHEDSAHTLSPYFHNPGISRSFHFFPHRNWQHRENVAFICWRTYSHILRKINHTGCCLQLLVLYSILTSQTQNLGESKVSDMTNLKEVSSKCCSTLLFRLHAWQRNCSHATWLLCNNTCCSFIHMYSDHSATPPSISLLNLSEQLLLGLSFSSCFWLLALLYA